jgi:predicted DNA-binding transcriptional regulator AlpA
VTPLVDTNDLIDARDVAEIIGLSQPGNVSLYQRRYPDMPRPVVTLGRGRCMLWLRPEVEAWAHAFVTSGRTRPKRRTSR